MNVTPITDEDEKLAVVQILLGAQRKLGNPKRIPDPYKDPDPNVF